MLNYPGYRIDGLFAETDTTEVYRAVQVADERRVLLKVTKAHFPSRTATQRLEREYDTLRRLAFEGHVDPVRLDRIQQRPVLVLQDPGGSTLRALLARRPLGLERFLKIAVEVAQLLAVMHRAGVVHCGIRPDNLLIDEGGGHVWIMGFESADLVSSAGVQTATSAPAEAALAYMSPEQTGRTHQTVDHRTDLYALGITFYEMLTGALPFEHKDPADLVHAHVAQQAEKPSDRHAEIPAVISDIVMKLLAKDPEDRYKSAHGLRSDLQKCLVRLHTTDEVGSFRLGEHDTADRIIIPRVLYGRESESAVLLRLFEKACAGSSEIVLVSGAAGAGKTSLVAQLRSRSQQRAAYFVEGKFDQMQQSVPYSALVQVCRDLIQQILTESEEAVAQWRKDILAGVGSIVQVIIDVVPELQLIVGSQPVLPPLAPIESQNRFNRAWQNFLGVFSRESRPLVIFLDDLQWADQATLGLIQQWMTNVGSYVLVVGAYRDRDVGPSHPLAIAVKTLQDGGVSVTHVHLPPLAKPDVTALLTETLHVEPEAAAALGEILLRKTRGNPLALIETLKLLERRELLRFDADHGSWIWDLAQIRSLDISENVVELLVDKICQLEPAVRSQLTLAACIGNTFDVRTLSTISGRTPGETISHLTTAVDAGLVRLSSDLDTLSLRSGAAGGADPDALSWRFLHDRIQQAAYVLIEENERPSVHLSIGRSLRSAAISEAVVPREKLFQLVDHFNRGAALLEIAEERVDLARLNLEASQKAKAATAFEVALDFARSGLEMVDSSHWDSEYDLMLGLHLERAECEVLVGDYESAADWCDRTLERVRTGGDRVLVSNVRIMLFTSQSRYADAVREGIAAARLLGLSLPEKPGQRHIIREFLKARWNLRGMKAQDLMNLPSMVDGRQVDTVNLLMNLTAPAFLSSEIFAILISLKLFNMSLQHGLSKATAYGFMVYAVVNAGLGKTSKAREFGEMGLRLREKLPNVEKGHILPFLFATAINHWTASASSNIDYLLQSYRASLDAGDLLYADYALITVVVNSFYKGDPLETVLEHCDRYVDFFIRVKGSAETDTAQRQAEIIQRQHARCLQGLTHGSTALSDDEFSEEAFLSEPKAPLVMLEYFTKKLQLLYLFDDVDRLPDLVEQSARTFKEVRITGDVRLSEHVFYEALALAMLPSTRERRKILSADRRELKRWAEACPQNFSHKHALVEAEVARAAGNDRQAMDLYDAAAEAAATFQFTHIHAMAMERAASFYMELRKDQIARTYASASRYGYSQWGASTKVRSLDERYGLDGSEGTESDGARRSPLEYVDLTSVARASRALSEEIVLERLLDRMGAVVIGNAGGEKGYLILEENGRLIVEAEIAIDALDAPRRPSIPLQESELVPRSIILYVMRTRETVVLEDASKAGMFVRDPYVASHHPRSVLCLPLIHQDRLTGALYLENNLATGVFTPSRLEVLRLLSAQLSISIENARLYRNLEQKVAERTEELKRKNADLESAMQHLKVTQAQLIQAEKMASLGQLTSGIAHELRNPLNFVNNFASLSAELISELEEEADATPDLRVEAIRDLIDDLKLNLVKIEEHGRRGEGIVGNMLEHSRATHGEREPTDLNALLREYVRVSTHTMNAEDPGFDVNVEWDIDGGLSRPEVIPQEIGRVLLNLLNNAFYAVRERRVLEGPPYVPTVHIVTRSVGEGVEIRIEDNGPGIPHELRDKIFEPFFTTKPTGEGTGLGLSLSYDIISRAYNGTLSHERSDGGGAAFVIRIPTRAAGDRPRQDLQIMPEYDEG